jgi:outer membrane protein OmpA-like peptidoglycan-associated protein
MNAADTFAELPPLSGEFETGADEFEDEARRRRPWQPVRAAVRSRLRIRPRAAAAWRLPLRRAFGRAFAPRRYGPPYRRVPWPVPWPTPSPWPAAPAAGGAAPAFAMPPPPFADDGFEDDEPPPEPAGAAPQPADAAAEPGAAAPGGDAPQGESARYRPRCHCARCAAGPAATYRGAGDAESDFESDFEADFEDEAGAGGACGAYEKTEVQRSRAAAGLLPADVIEHPRGLLIADFGVDWRTPRATLRGDAVLQRWLETMVKVVEANPKTSIRIVGYSDCVGSEKNNLHLRKGRAERVARLLAEMLGRNPAARALKSRLGTAVPAPGGEYVAPNDSVEGRARNRGVLVEVQREVAFEPETVCVVGARQAATYPLLRVVPNRQDVPRELKLEFRLHAKKMIGDVAQDISQRGHKAHFWVELAHAGLTAAEIFAEGSALVGLLSIGAPLLALAGVFLALGAPYAEAAKEIAEDWSARGYARGVVMGADGRKAALLRDYFGNDVMPKNHFFEQGQQIATANYRLGLLVGFVHGRLLCPNQRAAFWADMRNRLQGDQTYRGPSKQWSRREWIDWYVTTAATFRASHLQ